MIGRVIIGLVCRSRPAAIPQVANGEKMKATNGKTLLLSDDALWLAWLYLDLNATGWPMKCPGSTVALNTLEMKNNALHQSSVLSGGSECPAYFETGASPCSHGRRFRFYFLEVVSASRRCRVMAVWATSGVGTEGLCTTATEWISSIVLGHLNHCSSLRCIISHDAMPRPVCCFSCLVIQCSPLRKLH